MAANPALLLWGLLASAVAQLPPTAHVLPADAPLVKWVGRSMPDGVGGVLLDWEGVSATVSITSPTWVTVDIRDNCGGGPVGGGSRWAVDIATADAGVAPPHHRIATFFSSPFITTYALFSNQGGRCDPDCTFAGVTNFTLTRLTESRVSLCGPTGNLTVLSFASDGAFVAPPPPASRVIEFVGDSISAGDLNDGAGADGSAPGHCGNIAINDDITKTSGARLCLPPPTGFAADCLFTAWGGVTLSAMAGTNGQHTPLYDATFSGGGYGSSYGQWAFASHNVDAVVINLGTNDRPAPPALSWQASYANFGRHILSLYGSPPPTLFLAYGPMSAEYAPFVVNVTAVLTAQGVRAFPLNLTLPHPLTGCFGHPSAADNVEIAAAARPQVAAAMGWA